MEWYNVVKLILICQIKDVGNSSINTFVVDIFSIYIIIGDNSFIGFLLY